jgi:hypothetical protein
MSRTEAHVCDACEACWWGASKRDVLDEGWKFHDAKRGRMLTVCGDCERRFAQRRTLRVAPTIACSCACHELAWTAAA